MRLKYKNEEIFSRDQVTQQRHKKLYSLLGWFVPALSFWFKESTVDSVDFLDEDWRNTEKIQHNPVLKKRVLLFFTFQITQSGSVAGARTPVCSLFIPVIMTQLIEAGLVCRNRVGKHTETNDGDQPVCNAFSYSNTTSVVYFSIMVLVCPNKCETTLPVPCFSKSTSLYVPVPLPLCVCQCALLICRLRFESGVVQRCTRLEF
ncbi:uncharacterized protein [Danio rerio]|uniref:Uncharacterized protein n=2 Tax=Danio rerio TaxID=7955 RepID=A0AC58J2G7_DANRE